MKTMTLKVSDGLFNEIAGLARARNVSKSEVVRERLTRKPSASGRGGNLASLWHRMEDLVIPTDSLPADLSSNKSHMKGYGTSRSHR